MMLATLLVASIIVFALLHLFPGDPAAALASRGQRIPTPEAIETARREFGLDRPVVVRYLSWLGDAVRGDLGRSWVTDTPVTERLGGRLPATVLLGVVTFVLGLAITVVVGSLAALAPGGPVDAVSRLVATAGTAIPSFVLALLTIRFVAVELGIGSVITDGSLRTIALPAAVGGVGLAAYWVRPFRSIVLDVLASDWSVVGRARGWSTRRLLAVHVVPNACVAFLPFIGLGLAGIVAGSILVENVFAWPGMGPMVIESIRRRDLPVIQGFALVSTVAYVVSTRVVDLIARLADPHRTITRQVEDWS